MTLLTALFAAALFLPSHSGASASVDRPSSSLASQAKSPVSIDYREDGAIFPRHNSADLYMERSRGTSRHNTITFADKSSAIRAISSGERMHIGPIDPRCVSPNNNPPQLTPQQAESWMWIPNLATWSAIQLHSKEHPATLTITGYRKGSVAVSESHIAFTTSTDPVGAPILGAYSSSSSTGLFAFARILSATSCGTMS